MASAARTIMHFVSKHGWSTHHLLWPDQAPTGWKSWAERAADENVVIQIPDCCFASRRIEKRIIGLATSVEIGSTRQCQPLGGVGPYAPLT
jgi:hypothetical protein